jgi:hypothetical protein
MPKPSLTERVEILEQQVESHEGLPDRITIVEERNLQLGTELPRAVSALSPDMRAISDDLVARIEVRATRDETHAIRDDLVARIEAGDEETRRQMRMLHEDLIGRIELISEGRRPRKRKSR